MSITVQGLYKSYSGFRALDGVDLVVGEGELVGFLGPNGAGKTTTMRAIVGLTVTDHGSIYWRERPINVKDRTKIGYMPQQRGLYAKMKVHEQIVYFGRISGLDKATAKKRATYWAERVGLAERQNDQIQELSVGNQQRVQLAVALVHEPELLILDEPFAGLDPIAVQTLIKVMNDQVDKGTSVLFSSHQLDLVQDVASKVTIINKGKTIKSGFVTDIRHNSAKRIFKIRWRGDKPAWKPHNATELKGELNISRFEVDSESDPAELIAQASSVAPLQSVSFEPPGLEDVFSELITGTPEPEQVLSLEPTLTPGPAPAPAPEPAPAPAPGSESTP